MNYLSELTMRLAVGASRLDAATRERHQQWLVAKQRSDGGFAGREGESDPYYTAFGLRGLLLVDGISDDIASRAAAFLRGQMEGKLGIVDLISLLMAASILELTHGEPLMDQIRASGDRFADLLNSMRSGDGGYAKTPSGMAGSTYQTFLNLLGWELLGRSEPKPDSVTAFLKRQKQWDGGYREIRVAKRAGVNPTAAGIGALKTLGRLNVADEANTVEFLIDMQNDDGGMVANDRIPMSDLLSSCTGLISLIDLEGTQAMKLDALKRYARSMERTSVVSDQSKADMSARFGVVDWSSDEDAQDDEPTDAPEQTRPVAAADLIPGGFFGFEFDQVADVEYTFYGLATLALLETIE